jgi:hypothetical protein
MANLTISERAYQTIQQLASEQGQTPEAFIEAWAEQQARRHSSERDPYTNPRYQTFDEFFHELGMTDEEIADSKARAAKHADL